MVIEKLSGTAPRLYTLVAPLVMRRSILRQNNNYPFWTSRSHIWFVATEKEDVVGFIPVELTETGKAKINNYYISGDNPYLLRKLLESVCRHFAESHTIQSVTFKRHATVFADAGFTVLKEWKLYIKMEYSRP